MILADDPPPVMHEDRLQGLRMLSIRLSHDA